MKKVHTLQISLINTDLGGNKIDMLLPLIEMR